MKSDEMDRRDVVKALAGSATTLPLFPFGASAAEYSPKFFSAAEMNLVAMLGERILPQTETPGAMAAKVHEHIDLVVSEETPEVQRSFREGLSSVERRSRELHSRNFLALKPEEQNGILAGMATSTAQGAGSEGYRFFRDLRRRVVFAYYTSEIGLRQELTYKGKQVLGHWEGCPHSDRHGDSE